MQSSLLWRTIAHFRRAVWMAVVHDVFTSAKAAAYSAILSLIPALLVTTALYSAAPKSDTLTIEIRSGIGRILPSDTRDLAQIYSLNGQTSSARVLWSASLVAGLAAIGVMLSLMEGFRRAYRLPRRRWGFWRSRLIALALIPICLLPMIFASGFIVFGHQIEYWMVDNAEHTMQSYVLLLWRIVRWTLALATGIAVLTVLYHFGTPRTHSWRNYLPGATIATATWFLTTLAYGWYVTRFAVYMVAYGSLAAVIATLVWLYITSLSILIGAEFNAQIYPKRGLTGVVRRNDEKNGAA